MPTHSVDPKLLDRIVELGEQGDAVLAEIKAYPNAHPDQTKQWWEMYDAIQEEYARLSALEYRLRFGAPRRSR
jgi:hypothetical protein